MVAVAGVLGSLVTYRIAPVLVLCGLWCLVIAAAAVMVPRESRRRVALQAMGLMVLYLAVGGMQLILLRQSDSLGYFSTALQVAGLSGGEQVYSTEATGKEGFVRILSVLLRLGEPSMMVPVAFNAGLLAVTFLVSYRATVDAFGRSAARFVPLVYCVAPPLLIWGSAGLRETSVYFGIACAVAISVSCVEKISSTKLLGLGLASVYLLVFRGPVALVVVAAAGLGIVLSAKGFMRRPHLILMFAFVGLIVVVVFQTYGDQTLADYYDQERINTARGSLGSANSGFTSDSLSPGTVGLGLLRVLFGPFPWEWLQFPLAIADALFWLGSWLLIYRSIRQTGIRMSLPLLLPAAALALAVALTVTNYGALLRIRAMVLIPLVPVLSHGLHIFLTRRRRLARAVPSRGSQNVS